MKTFYVSDSFTLPFQDFQTTNSWHFPGPFNSEITYTPGAPVDLEVIGGECAHILYVDVGLTQGTAMDVYLAFYDINVPPGAPAIPFPGYLLKFLDSNGAPMADANLLNSITRLGPNGGNYSPVSRRFAGPIRVGGTAPSAPGAWQVGAAIRFFGAPGLNGVPTEYQYYLQGYQVTPSTPPPPPPPPPGQFVVTTPDGTKWGWDATMVP